MSARRAGGKVLSQEDGKMESGGALLAIAAYRCEIGGKRSDSIDIQVRYFASGTTQEIEDFLRTECTHSYRNDDDELVSWPYVALLAVEQLQSPQTGREVVGFITGCYQFPAWASGTKSSAIAHRLISASHPDRGEFEIDVQIGCPYEVSADEWACPVHLVGLYSKLTDQHGVDSFQALMLAQHLARTLLSGFIEDGGTLRDSPGGKPIDIQSMFTAGTTS
jgi:hypothetical protein